MELEDLVSMEGVALAQFWVSPKTTQGSSAGVVANMLDYQVKVISLEKVAQSFGVLEYIEWISAEG